MRLDTIKSNEAYKRDIVYWMEDVSFKKSMREIILHETLRYQKNHMKLVVRYSIYKMFQRIEFLAREYGEERVQFCERYGDKKTIYLVNLIRFIDDGSISEMETEEGAAIHYDYQAVPQPKCPLKPEDVICGWCGAKGAMREIPCESETCKAERVIQPVVQFGERRRITFVPAQQK